MPGVAEVLPGAGVPVPLSVVPDVPGLPELPPIPEVPELPELPPMPDVPGLPELPPMPDVPELPELPPMPDVPGVPEVPPMPDVPELPPVPPEVAPPVVPVPVPVPVAPGIAPAAPDGDVPELPPPLELLVPLVPLVPLVDFACFFDLCFVVAFLFWLGEVAAPELELEPEPVASGADCGACASSNGLCSTDAAEAWFAFALTPCDEVCADAIPANDSKDIKRVKDTFFMVTSKLNNELP
jgi:hypothetical protein